MNLPDTEYVAQLTLNQLYYLHSLTYKQQDRLYRKAYDKLISCYEGGGYFGMDYRTIGQFHPQACGVLQFINSAFQG